MPRNYTVPTIKTLFGEASECAYPDCREPLVFRDRGVVTVVAEIAHIRSEKPGGPRHDPSYQGDINGPENLLLLCGKHHRPVDRHEVVYTIDELEAWKETQRRTANGGTPISAEDARAFTRLTDEERTALSQIARLAERVIVTSEAAQADLDGVEAAYQQARTQSQQRLGPVWEVDDDGNRTLITHRIELPNIERQKWVEKAQQVRQAHHQHVAASIEALREEVAVLRMMGGVSVDGVRVVVMAADQVDDTVGDEAQLRGASQALTTAVASLWRTANGEIEP